jgi:trehalose/maltose hydrolase-like predicted phosphorylase
MPVSPPAEHGAIGQDLPAYLSNGVVGLRVRDNPLAAGMTLLCGYSGLHAKEKIEAAADAPYPLAGDLALNGVWLSDAPQQLTIVDQAYDFSNGELTSRLRFRVAEVEADLVVVTFCCRHQPTLVTQEIAVKTNTSCDVKLKALIDTRQVHGALKACKVGKPGQDLDGSLLWESDGGLSRCGIAFNTILLGDDGNDHKVLEPGDRGLLVAEYSFKARAGKLYRLRQIASLVPSVMHGQPDGQAERLVALGAHYGFDELRKANRAEWKALWMGRIVLHGASTEWQQLADAAFFYMNTSAHASSPASTSMFGLATWGDYHHYYGHVMWDIETFSVPVLSLLQPEAAEALLQYRFRNLDQARSNAQCFGRRGLQFPWESAPTSGDEAAPPPGTASWHEDHVSLDVALAFVRYAYSTGDRNFLREKAWPVLSGVADWLVSRTHQSRRGYEIRRSMGIAERKCESDNEAFTMLSAKAVLEAALRTAQDIGQSPGADWAEISAKLVLPIRNGVLVSHDDFRVNEEKGATPSPLMALFPLEAGLGADVERKTLDFYLKLAPNYIGSPMLSAFYGVWAARRGDRALCLKLLRDGYASFASGRFLQTLEYRPDKFPEQPKAGPFFANMGAFLLDLLIGFPGLNITPGEPSAWPQHDVVLPQGWKAIEVERLWVHGRPARLFAQHGKRCEITFL